ncbi:MAG: hypothetical protein AABO41_19830 [Acidobacteriota bacterium]
MKRTAGAVRDEATDCPSIDNQEGSDQKRLRPKHSPSSTRVIGVLFCHLTRFDAGKLGRLRLRLPQPMNEASVG